MSNFTCIEAKVVKDSIAYNGCRLTTFELKYPRAFVHEQLLTHRDFSRNSASERAIPAAKYRQMILDDDFIPSFGKNMKGMSAKTLVDDPEKARAWWLASRALALSAHEEGERLGLHKEVVNRVLRPFACIRTLVTATEWENFFRLRKTDAQPEMMDLAGKMELARLASEPETIEPKHWHSPYLTEDDANIAPAEAIYIVAGRCARISYLGHDGSKSTEADYRLGIELSRNGHMSPFEHLAISTDALDTFRYANFRGWRSARHILETAKF